MPSRLITDLLPNVAKAAQAALGECSAAGYEVLVTCTFRSPKEQQAEFLAGHSKAKAWQSYHQYKRALDVVVMRNGKCIWNPVSNADRLLWNSVGDIFIKHGFEWAKYWKSFPELAHFQMTEGKTWQVLQRELGVTTGQVTNLPKGY
jgi:peptidoglycan L-alanyl-D-glutamate endopeptidase CwlK